MADLGPALIGLIGAGLGSLVTFLIARSNQQAVARTHQVAQADAKRSRLQELIIDAYVSAREGVGWLHQNNVEDSVLDPWRVTYEPQVRESLGQVRQARLALDKAAALAGDGPLAEAADRAAAALLVFENAWVAAREYADKMHNGAAGQRRFAEGGFKREYDRLIDSRAQLTGMRKSLRSQEINGGGLAPSGLLAELRRAAGSGSVSQQIEAPP